VAARRQNRLNVGVGERARADARIILEGVKTEVYK
jgi:hypothetical protein